MAQDIIARRHHLDRRAADLAEAGAGDGDDLLNTTELAEWLQVSEQWLEIGRSKHYGPPFVRLAPTRIRYKRSSVLRWLKEREFSSTSQYAKEAGGAP